MQCIVMWSVRAPLAERSRPVQRLYIIFHWQPSLITQRVTATAGLLLTLGGALDVQSIRQLKQNITNWEYYLQLGISNP